VIPGIAIEQIDRHEPVAGFDLAYELPFRSYAGGDGLFGEHMLAACESLANLLRSRVRQGKQSHRINGGVTKDGIGVVVDGRIWHLPMGQLARLDADVVHRRHIQNSLS
jgi:hypothetical protein